MGWHYILNFKCKLLPEHIKFIEAGYLRNHSPEDDECVFDYNNYDYIHGEWHDDYINGLDDYELADYVKRDGDCVNQLILNRIEGIRLREKEINEELANRIEVREREYEAMSKNWRDLIDIWNELCIGARFYKYDLSGDIFTCRISKKVTDQKGCLREAYERFLKDIIVPISEEIYECHIESDDFGDAVWHYTDSELRGMHFSLQDKIKRVEHIYNDEGTEIIESRVIYKHSIKLGQLLDLNRCYGKG
jgi:hypothetical protein